MRLLAEYTGQCRQIHPLTDITAVVPSIVHTVGTGISHGIRGDEPARAVSPEHQPIVALGRIMAESVFQHILKDLRVAGILVLLADAHIGYRDAVGYFTVADTCQPR